MISIERKGAVPLKLSIGGLARAQQHCADFDADPTSYQLSKKTAGAKEFSIDNSIYGHHSVKRALEKMQFGKCCYCEVFIEKPYAIGHVEHFRPKAFSQQTRRSNKIRPGYYWLAYNWDNLFLSCPFCNSSNKANLFPLSDPTQRARNHHDDTAVEQPLLLKPDGPENPRDHIGFRGDTPFGMTPLGVATVEVLGLDRREHAKRQRRMRKLEFYHMTVVKHHLDTSALALEVVGRARQYLADALKPEAPFSAMALTFLEQNPLP